MMTSGFWVLTQLENSNCLMALRMLLTLIAVMQRELSTGVGRPMTGAVGCIPMTGVANNTSRWSVVGFIIGHILMNKGLRLSRGAFASFPPDEGPLSTQASSGFHFWDTRNIVRARTIVTFIEKPIKGVCDTKSKAYQDQDSTQSEEYPRVK